MYYIPQMPKSQLLKQNPNSQVAIHHSLELKIILMVTFFPFPIFTSVNAPADVGITLPTVRTLMCYSYDSSIRLREFSSFMLLTSNTDL